MTAAAEIVWRADGTGLAVRADGEEPFALIVPPKLRPRTRSWGVHFRSYGQPFNRRVANTSAATLAATLDGVRAELAWCVANLTGYQLGLEPQPQTKDQSA